MSRAGVVVRSIGGRRAPVSIPLLGWRDGVVDGREERRGRGGGRGREVERVVGGEVEVEVEGRNVKV